MGSVTEMKSRTTVSGELFKPPPINRSFVILCVVAAAWGIIGAILARVL